MEENINIPEQHCHSSLSHDSKGRMILMVAAAIVQGCEKITFTEHYDCYDGVIRTKGKGVNFEKYQKKIRRMRRIYDDEIDIGFGVEIGMRSESKIASKIMHELNQYDFDLVIGSVHITNGVDVSMDPSFFKDKTKREAYGEYFDEVSTCIDIYHDAFDVMGHLDYIVRYGDYMDNELGTVFDDQIDEILRKLVMYDKGLEINTSGFAKGFDTTFPGLNIVRRFKELGGKYITIGSDSHGYKNIAAHFDDAASIAREAGFTDITYYKNRKPIMIPLILQ